MRCYVSSPAIVGVFVDLVYKVYTRIKTKIHMARYRNIFNIHKLDSSKKRVSLLSVGAMGVYVYINGKKQYYGLSAKFFSL